MTFKILGLEGWRNGSIGKTASRLGRVPELGSQHPCQGIIAAYNSSSKAIQCPLLTAAGTCAPTHTHAHTHNLQKDKPQGTGEMPQ